MFFLESIWENKNKVRDFIKNKKTPPHIFLILFVNLNVDKKYQNLHHIFITFYYFYYSKWF